MFRFEISCLLWVLIIFNIYHITIVYANKSFPKNDHISKKWKKEIIDNNQIKEISSSDTFITSTARNLKQDQTTPTISTNCSRSFHPKSIQQFLHSRTCSIQDPRKSNSIWVYEGYLIDPFNGRRIAEVEGVELVRHLTENFNYPNGVNDPPTNKEEGKKANDEDINKTKRNLKERLGDLSISSILFPSETKKYDTNSHSSTSINAPSWDYANTVLSRKLFCYRDPNDKRKLLSSIRIRPGVGKVRQIKKKEAVVLYDTATTFISRDNGKELAIFTEWPNGRSILANAEYSAGNKELYSDWDMNDPLNSSLETSALVNSNSLSSSSIDENIENNDVLTPESLMRDDSKFTIFEYNIYAKGQTAPLSSKNRELPKLPLTRSQIIQSYKGRKDVNFDEATISPPRTKFIQFGPDKRTNDKYGARESYTYSFPLSQLSNTNIFSNPIMKNAPSIVKRSILQLSHTYEQCYQYILSKRNINESNSISSSPCTVRYTRYGESPPWYGIGRMCTLELVGKKVPSLAYVPPLVASLAAQNIPGFASVNNPIASSNMVKSLTNTDESLDQSSDIVQDLNNNYVDDEEMDLSAQKAIKWFRDDDGLYDLLQDDDEDELFTRIRKNFNKESKGSRKVVYNVGSFMNKLRKAIIIG